MPAVHLSPRSSAPVLPPHVGDVGDRLGVAAAVADHLDRHVADSPEALLFGTSSAGYLARSWNQTFRRAAEAIGLPSVRPHELRHTGATLAAATGATTKELMRQLGSSPAAALVYQHAADDRDAEIARALDATLSAASGSLSDASDEGEAEPSGEWVMNRS